jgi:hypothetical protein
VQQRPTSSFVNIAGNTITADVLAIHIIDESRVIDVIATHRHRPKRRCADSESQTLAIKKFSRLARQRLIRARQNRIFGRIGATRFAGAALVETTDFEIATNIHARRCASIVSAAVMVAVP